MVSRSRCVADGFADIRYRIKMSVAPTKTSAKWSEAEKVKYCLFSLSLHSVSRLEPKITLHNHGSPLVLSKDRDHTGFSFGLVI